ncbi:hypothetical protein D9M68_843500 [compost metagenome]
MAVFPDGRTPLRLTEEQYNAIRALLGAAPAAPQQGDTINVPRDEVERLVNLLRYQSHPNRSPHADYWESLLQITTASTATEGQA